MNKDQVSGAADRAVTVAVTWLFTYLSTKGYITPSQSADFMPLALGIAVAVYGWWVNRPKAIAQAAANIPNTTVVTTPDLADSIPASNVVSNADVKVTSK